MNKVKHFDVRKDSQQWIGGWYYVDLIHQKQGPKMYMFKWRACLAGWWATR